MCHVGGTGGGGLQAGHWSGLRSVDQVGIAGWARGQGENSERGEGDLEVIPE